jgi:hypothetical protein
MQICSPTSKVRFQAGTYKPKKANIKKLKVYLNKIENGS